MVVNATTKVDWQQGQDALRDEVRRVTTLLRSIQDPTPPAVGQWNLGEVAMHLSQTWVTLPGQAKGDLSRIYEVVPGIAGTAGNSLLRDIWDLADFTTLAVKNDPERDLGVIADRIEAEAEQYFSEFAEADPNAPRPWMIEGVTVTLAHSTYHLLNETLIHGYDIAHAVGHKWRIEPAHAAMALGRFIIPVLQQSGPRVYVNGTTAAGLRATYDIRVRGGERFFFIFEDGKLTVEEPSSRPVDCHISADPAAFLLVAFGRQSQWSAIAQGKLMAWGRKPWLGFQFKSLLRTP